MLVSIARTEGASSVPSVTIKVLLVFSVRYTLTRDGNYTTAMEERQWGEREASRRERDESDLRTFQHGFDVLKSVLMATATVI